MTSVAPKAEAGLSLLELLMAVAIMGIAMVGIIGVMGVAIVGSDAHRRMASSEVVIRSFSEAIELANVRPATSKLMSPIPGHAAGAANIQVVVQSTAGFPNRVGYHLVADAESFTVTTIVNSTTVKATASGTAAHAINAPVSQYLPCPNAADLFPAGYVTPSNFATPQITSVTYWIPDSPTLESGSYGSSCSDTACLGDGASCDSGLVKAQLSAQSTDVGPRFVKSTTEIVLKRPNL